jgi:hypothetical protein
MKRVYTDENFPGYEVVNNGRTLFEVFLRGKIVSTFESWDRPDGTITETAAARRAVDFFNRMRAVPLEEMDVAELPEGINAPVRRPTTQEIDQLMSKEKLESVSERRQALRRHILNLMRQEESLAEAVVNHLVEAP